MNEAVFILVLMAVAAMLIAAAAGVFGLNLKVSQFAQTGDSSLGPRSVNWLVAIAFGVAIWICLK